MSNRHAHVSEQSSDCDGPKSSHHVVTMNDEEIAESGKTFNDFSDIHFRERVVGDHVSPTTFQDGQSGTMTIHEHGFEFSRDTDEGYRRIQVIWCEDDCDLRRVGQRGHFAESMGY